MSLPIVVSAARAWVALFRCQAQPLQAIVPPPLEPVIVRGGRTPVAVAIYEFEDTSIGPYYHASIGFAVRYRPWFSLPMGATMLERRVGDYGYWQQVVASSTDQSIEIERSTWGMPSFLAELRVQAKRSKVKATVLDNGVEVFNLEMKRPGPGMPMRFPYRTYSRQGDEILRTEMNVDAIGVEKSMFASAKLTLQRHERVEPLRELNIEASSPMEVRWYDSYRTRIDQAVARYRVK